MKYAMNIGLDAQGVPLDADLVRASVVCMLGETHSTVVESHTETTLWAEVDCESDQAMRCACDFLARLHNQDCIAIWNESTGHGELVGPNAAAWGEFNPDYFICANGQPLAELMHV